MRTIIFDLDGTLADTAADLAGAANVVFRGLGHGNVIDPVGDAFIAYNHGGRGMLRAGFERLGVGLGDDEVELHFPHLLAAYEADIARHTRLYDGAEETLNALKSQGYALGVCTNKTERLAAILLQSLGVADLFGALVGADTLATRKPDAAPYLAAVSRAGGNAGQSLLVGDTLTDRKTATAAGVPCVLVTFGAEGPGVAALEPDALLDRYDELPGIAARLIG